jgi:hypothetical protein
MDEADEEFDEELDDEELLAEWAAAEAAALAELRSALSELPDRPLPRSALRTACERIRAVMAQPGWPRELMAACGGVDPERLPAEDSELWLTLASGIVGPRDELANEPEPDDDDTEDDEFADVDLDLELSADEEALVALCALDVHDWLAVATSLARGGPGTAAGPEALASYVSQFDPEDPDDQADAAAGMFARAVELWEVLGAVRNDRLTPLGWWGIPDSVQRAWAPSARE